MENDKSPPIDSFATFLAVPWSERGRRLLPSHCPHLYHRHWHQVQSLTTLCHFLEGTDKILDPFRQAWIVREGVFHLGLEYSCLSIEGMRKIDGRELAIKVVDGCEGLAI